MEAIDPASAQAAAASSVVSLGDGTPKWYRFDDRSVNTYNPKDIERDCFGGTET